jgi:hypothetical protein
VIFLGEIVRLQVQEYSLKVGEGVSQRYDPSGIRQVDRLELNGGGVRGSRGDAQVADVHHRDHPHTKLRGTLNSISFGFTGHYQMMHDRFGIHLENGISGENILISNEGRVNLTDVEHGVIIQTSDRQSIHLQDVLVAAPCAPFTRWSLRFPDDQRPDRTVTQALQYLGDGMRGYYCRYTGEPVSVELGDAVFAIA